MTGTGKIEALETVEVGTHVSGQIAELFVDFNDRVEQGQLLSRIDPTILRQEVRSADANLMRSRADLEQAERELKRARELHESRVMTTSELETAALLRPEAQKRLTVPLGHGAATRANLDAWVSRRHGGWAIGDSAEPSAWGGYSAFSASVGWIPAARLAAR